MTIERPRKQLHHNVDRIVRLIHRNKLTHIFTVDICHCFELLVKSSLNHKLTYFSSAIIDVIIHVLFERFHGYLFTIGQAHGFVNGGCYSFAYFLYGPVDFVESILQNVLSAQKITEFL
jgi:hypothetical protein